VERTKIHLRGDGMGTRLSLSLMVIIFKVVFSGGSSGEIRNKSESTVGLCAALLLEPSPVVALARKVYATVRLRSRDYGVDSLCRARQPPTPFSGKVLMERRNTCARLA